MARRSRPTECRCASSPHAEAFTTLTRRQVQFPEILEAYAAVERWIDESDRTVAGAPREVYFTTEEAQRLDEPFCDVCFPIT
jgi:effector-binding domain-containing protein